MIALALAGGSSSGKTTLAKRINKDLVETSYLRTDDYYKDFSNLTLEERKKINFDHPDSFDMELMVKHIKDLKNNIPIEAPTYDFVNHKRSELTTRVTPKNLILIEGIFALISPELRELYDMKVYVETADDIRLLRRIKRDIEERGRTLDFIIQQYQNYVRPMHFKYIEPTKEFADIIIPRGGKNDIGVYTLESALKELLNK
ncbi:MAG: uridine kinase [Bacillales bacterium]|jgi:uridine kinase|nr:uridine kinase [Bacillales bacterium]